MNTEVDKEPSNVIIEPEENEEEDEEDIFDKINAQGEGLEGQEVRLRNPNEQRQKFDSAEYQMNKQIKNDNSHK